jgi:hypothetical protein
LLVEAQYCGISERTLEKAKEKLGLRSVRQGGLGPAGRWYWRRPTDAEIEARRQRRETR